METVWIEMMSDHRMQCMEVWGSNRAVDSMVTMTGLDVWAVSQPFEQNAQGGDVYYLSSCASGRISRLLLADVSGHGNEVAQISESLRNLMRRHVNYISQTRIAEKVNDEFTAISENGGFATALILTYFAPRRTLSVSNAGHPPPLIYQKKCSSWTALGQNDNSGDDVRRDLPLGVIHNTSYSSTSMKLDEGDLVLCFSDAFIEAVTPEGELLHLTGLQKILADAPVHEPSEIIPWVIQQLKQINPVNLQADDATIILLTANPLKVSLRNNLLAPIRFLGDLVSRVTGT